MKLKLTHYIILVCLGIIGYLLWFKNDVIEVPGDIIYIKGEPYEVIKRIIDTVKITKRDTIEKKGKDIFHDTTIYVTITEPIDTASILKDYYSKKVYKDTLKLSNDIGVVLINDTIFKNSIHHRKYFTEVSEKYITDMTIVKEAQRLQIFYGGNLSFNKQNKMGAINAGLILKSKKDNLYQFGVGIMDLPSNNSVSPLIMGGVYKKIRLKK